LQKDNPEADDFENDEDGEVEFFSNQYIGIDQYKNESLQRQLRSKFLESFELLDDPDQGKEAESHMTFCLYRLEPHETIRDQVVNLLTKLPWRSEAISSCLGRFKYDPVVVERLKEFISDHKVYSWHQAQSLWALYRASKAKDVASICRAWLADTQLDWYARTIAAKILAKVPSQHAYFFECLKREQDEINGNAEATAILRQELAYSAFQRIKSSKKQFALLKLICSDPSPLLHRLVIYLLQQPQCLVTWDDLKPYHHQMSNLSNLVRSLGLSEDAPRSCLIAKTMVTMYGVDLSSKSDLRPLYGKHYDKAVEQLRESVINYQNSLGSYISSFHQFTHITFLAFYEYFLPNEGGIYESGYAGLIDRKAFRETLPRGVDAWQELNSMRNRIEHPVDRKTKSHSKKLTFKEGKFLKKQLHVALQEMFHILVDEP